jgi:hypothetical protein
MQKKREDLVFTLFCAISRCPPGPRAPTRHPPSDRRVQRPPDSLPAGGACGRARGLLGTSAPMLGPQQYGAENEALSGHDRIVYAGLAWASAR